MLTVDGRSVVILKSVEPPEDEVAVDAELERVEVTAVAEGRAGDTPERAERSAERAARARAKSQAEASQESRDGDSQEGDSQHETSDDESSEASEPTENRKGKRAKGKPDDQE